MNHLSLFSGIGGIDLAGEWAGMKSVAFCEREQFPRRVLAAHWPGIPIYDDVCTLTKEVLQRDGIIGPSRTIDAVSAGFPCQPFSAAGKREGTDDERYLWPEVVRVLQDIEPPWFIGENVAGIISMAEPDGAAQVESRTIQLGEEEDFYEAIFTQQERMLFGNICKDLEDITYEVQVFVIPAAAVGAKHLRERVFIVAYSDSFNRRRRDEQGQSARDSSGKSTGNRDQPLGNTASQGLQEWRQARESESYQETGAGMDAEPERPSEVVANSNGKSSRGLSIGERETNSRSSFGCENVANSYGVGDNGQGECRTDRDGQESMQKRELPQHGLSNDCQNVADTSSSRQQECHAAAITDRPRYGSWSSTKRGADRTAQSGMGRGSDELPHWLDGSGVNPLDRLTDVINSYPQPTPLGMQQYGWEPPRVDTGVKDRVPRLKSLGNAVDPLQIYPVMVAIKTINDSLTHQKGA